MSGGVGGGAGISTGRLKLNSDVAKLFLFLPTIPTKSFPKPSALLREEIIDFFFLSTPFSFLFLKLLKGGGLTFPNSTLINEARLLTLYYRARPDRVDTISAERGPLEEEEDDEDGACVL